MTPASFSALGARQIKSAMAITPDGPFCDFFTSSLLSVVVIPWNHNEYAVSPREVAQSDTNDE
jgi:hypothetical protein